MSRKNRLFINDVSACVDEMLQGLVMGNPQLQLVEGHKVVVRKDIEEVKGRGEVTVICGGGSGHEPFAGGFVGQGMLSAAVAGSVFASPPPTDILAALKAVQSSAGTLVIVANYTGDRLNFGIAQERAKHLGIKTSMVVVAEDCALASSDKTAGRRGLVGIVNIMKIAGCLAEQGRTLEEIAAIAQHAADNMGTIGVSLSACSVPGTGPSFQLPEAEMELGLGAHGEAGVKRMKLLPANETIEVMVDHMLDVDNVSHLSLNDGDEIALTLNNLGGLSELEMHVLAKRAIEYLETICESIEMICRDIIASEGRLNDLDTTGGDGDCGSTLKRGAEEILQSFETVKTLSLGEVFSLIASCAESSMGGASGGLYSLFFTAAALKISKGLTLRSWYEALSAGMEAVTRYGGAEVGDRTMLDALHPVKISLQESIDNNEDFKAAARKAANLSFEGAKSTAHLKAKAGRASYVESAKLTKPDPGAIAVSIWMNSIAKCLE